MASQIIGTTIAGTVADSTGMGFQSHLIWAVNDAAWWLFYISSTDTTHVLTYRSPDGVTWTAKTASGAVSTALVAGALLDSKGRSLGCTYKNISGNDVVHLTMCCVGTTQENIQHSRASISGGAVTWAAWDNANANRTTASGTLPIGCRGVIDSNNLPVDIITVDATQSGNPSGNRATNTDAGTSWTAGFGTATLIEAPTNFANACCLFDLGGGNLLALWENAAQAEAASMDNVRWSKYTGTWTAGADVFTSALSSGQNPNFGAVAVSTSDVHCIIRSSTGSAYTHRRFNGTSWSNGDTIPNQTSGSTSGILLATDGTNVWMVIIDTDAPHTVRYNKWTSGVGWGTWTALETTTKTRNFLTGSLVVAGDANKTIGVIWSETNGSNFDIVFEGLATAPGVLIDYPKVAVVGGLQAINIGYGVPALINAQKAA